MSTYLLMAYLLSNISAKNYWNRTTTVEIIVGGWVVSFFETAYNLTTSVIQSQRVWHVKIWCEPQMLKHRGQTDLEAKNLDSALAWASASRHSGLGLKVLASASNNNLTSCFTSLRTY